MATPLPEELVRKVTGHSAVDVVREHYFKPGREALRDALVGKMPAMFSLRSEAPKRRDAAALIQAALVGLVGMTPSNWEAARDGLVAVLMESTLPGPQHT